MGEFDQTKRVEAEGLPKKRPTIELFPIIAVPIAPTWDDIVQLSYHEPILRHVVMMATMPYSNVSRELALTMAVFALYNAKAGMFQREVDRRNVEMPDFIMVEGKRYDRRTE